VAVYLEKEAPEAYTEVLDVIHGNGVAVEVEHGILEHAGVA